MPADELQPRKHRGRECQQVEGHLRLEAVRDEQPCDRIEDEQPSEDADPDEEERPEETPAGHPLVDTPTPTLATVRDPDRESISARSAWRCSSPESGVNGHFSGDVEAHSLRRRPGGSVTARAPTNDLSRAARTRASR